MAARTRPEGCCPARPVPQLPGAEQSALVAAFKALADPTRLEIFRLVMGQPGPICSCDIVDHFDLAQPTISHHLKVLRGADLLTSTARQILLYRCACWDVPDFFHCPLLRDHDGVRLAKRADAVSLRGLRQSGFTPSHLRSTWQACPVQSTP